MHSKVVSTQYFAPKNNGRNSNRRIERRLHYLEVDLADHPSIALSFGDALQHYPQGLRHGH